MWANLATCKYMREEKLYDITLHYMTLHVQHNKQFGRSNKIALQLQTNVGRIDYTHLQTI